MKYYVYTDACSSAERKKSSYGFLILTDDRYITSDGGALTMCTPTYAEDYAIGLACQYITDNIDINEDDIVTVYTDCAAAIKLFKTLLKVENFKERDNDLASKSITRARVLSSKCKFRFYKVKGHRDKLNPNTFVDRIAKVYLRAKED